MREPLTRNTDLVTSFLRMLGRQPLVVAVVSYRLHSLHVVSPCHRVPSLKRRCENPMHHNVSVTSDGAGEVGVAWNGQGVVFPRIGFSRRHVLRELHWNRGHHRARLAVQVSRTMSRLRVKDKSPTLFSRPEHTCHESIAIL